MNVEKAPDALKTISEAAEEVGVETHVLRFWEKQFPQLSPEKHRGNRRYYRPEDITLLLEIKELLYGQGFTIQGARQQLKRFNGEENEIKSLQSRLEVLHRELCAMRDMIQQAQG